MMGHGSEGTWLWMLVPALLLFAVIAFGVWAAVKTTGSRETTTEASALSILEGRYAKGEISKAEFDETKHALRLA